MKRIFPVAIFLFFFVAFGSAQFTEDFNDGDFTTNPAWTGNTADFIVNASGRLQSANTVANATFYLSTANSLATTAQWELTSLLVFSTSSTNYVDIFVTASASDVTLPGTTGYFVRLGGTDDEVCLFRKDNGSITKIIDGVNGSINSSNNTLQVRLVRNAANTWILSRNINNSGFITEGTSTDATYTTSSFFSILVKQSTASFFQLHFFDDISVGTFVPDILPPTILDVSATNNTGVDVLFNEPVDLSTSQTVSNYAVSNGFGAPVSAVRDAVNQALVHLTFTGTFPQNTNLQLTVSNVADLSGNAITSLAQNFMYSIPGQYAVVIAEIMADPEPQVGLPNAEWVELKNTSSANIDLLNWRLAKPSGQSGQMPSFVLRPDSSVIVCTASAVPLLSPFGQVISVTSFPSLSNGGDLIFLISSQGRTGHSVNYTDAWYDNQLKKDGGWSVEMIDTRNPCSGNENWTASNDPSGGTPGRRNSVDALNADITSIQVLRAYASDPFNVTVVFSESVDSLAASQPTNFSITDGIGTPISAAAVGPRFDRINLQLTTALQPGRIYTITVGSGTSDCSGNSIGTRNTARVGLAEPSIDSFDIVINEILFNPSSLSNDYVEIYNRSSKILNLKNVSIANASDFKRLSVDDYAFFPGDFIVATNSKDLVLNVYVANNPDAFIEIDMPSYNDTEGDVRILNEQGRIIDRVEYLDDWHFALISNEEGVALERVDYNAPSQSADNWHSAASTVGYGTPTYKNSQLRVAEAPAGEITVMPQVFSPDNDGRDDLAFIEFKFPEAGYVTNIRIFDAAGRHVRYLQRNSLSGQTGTYRWDGLGDNNQKLQAGIYVIYTEVFNLQGKTKKFKNTIVLAGRK